MYEPLHSILDIQELDIKMIRLMRIKKQRLNELGQIESLRKDLQEQLSLKRKEIEDLDKQSSSLERKLAELSEKYKQMEMQQSSVKKVEEFNALTKEMTGIEREKAFIETQASNLLDRKVSEEEILEKIKVSLKESEASSVELENEISTSIEKINEEGATLKLQRDELAKIPDPEVLKIYERLLRNKKDRVVVPIENRICSGCHISLTIQHENLVRKANALVFCEHCSRIHYWLEEESQEGAATKRRRRRVVRV